VTSSPEAKWLTSGFFSRLFKAFQGGGKSGKWTDKKIQSHGR
jgi:hypothetical protein